MIVIDMPFPASCKECPFAREAGLDCIVFDRDDSETRFITGKVFDAGSKPEWCPIIGQVSILERNERKRRRIDESNS
jgi:hypothetical protein